jgi:pyruvate formate lyase activating enzyme
MDGCSATCVHALVDSTKGNGITGVHLQPVLDTLVYLKRETKVWLEEITTLLIPGENDSDAELDAMTQ